MHRHFRVFSGGGLAFHAPSVIGSDHLTCGVAKMKNLRISLGVIALFALIAFPGMHNGRIEFGKGMNSAFVAAASAPFSCTCSCGYDCDGCVGDYDASACEANEGIGCIIMCCRAAPIECSLQ